MSVTFALLAIGVVASAAADRVGWSCPVGQDIINAYGYDGAQKFCRCQLNLPTSIYVQIASPTSVSYFTLTDWTTTTLTVPTPITTVVTTTARTTYTPLCYDATASSGLAGLMPANFTLPADTGSSTAIAARNAIPPYPVGRARLVRRNSCDTNQTLTNYTDTQLSDACNCLWYGRPVVTETIPGAPYDVAVITESHTATVTQTWSEGTPTVTSTDLVTPTAEQCATPTPWPNSHPWLCAYLNEMTLQDETSGQYIIARPGLTNNTFRAGLTSDKSLASKFSWGLTLISSSNEPSWGFDDYWESAWVRVNLTGSQSDAIDFIGYNEQNEAQWNSPGMVNINTYQDPLDCKYSVLVPSGEALQLCDSTLTVQAPNSSCTALGRLVASTPLSSNSTTSSSFAVPWREQKKRNPRGRRGM